MTKETLSAETLRHIPLFSNMNDSERRQLADIATVKTFAASDIVCRQGQRSQNLWVVLEGECEVVKEPPRGAGQPVLLASLAPFSNFGEMSFFEAATHSATVRAKTAVKLLRIERADYDELVDEGTSAASKLACNTIVTLAGRLRRMDEWVTQLVLQPAGAAAAQPSGTPSAEAASGVSRIPEWTAFRDKLFTGWNL